jgi:pimeloyl-ACP methyl ester carboxylesterase
MQPELMENIMSEHLPTFDSRSMVVNGVTLNVIIEGAGPDVVLVHGFPDSHQVWRHQIPALVAAGYRVIAPDIRGFGRSEAPTGKGSYRVENFVSDLAAMLDVLEIDKVRLVGHDWGAVITWAFTIEYPERVDRHVAMSVGHPAAYPRGGLAQKIKGYYVLICASPIGEWFLKLFNWRMFKLVLNYPAEVLHWQAEMSRPGRLYAAIGIYRDNLHLVLPGKYPNVNVPVMGIWSSGDHALSRKQMFISGEYVDGPWRYEQVDGASHWLQLDAPDKINALLLEYLAGQAARPPEAA